MPSTDEASTARRSVGPTAGSTTLTWRAPDATHACQVAEILEAAGLFRAEEIDVALEVFDAYCDEPGRDYQAAGVFVGPETLVGFAFYGPTPCTVDTWDLYWIAVRNEYRCAGIGRALLGRVEEHLVSCNARMCLIETSSRPDYAATRKFYAACGYRAVARVADYYADGDDRIVYTRRLSTE